MADGAGTDTGTGLCLLTLDGGGIRGLSSLMILQRLMEAIDPENPPKPCDIFHMIGGTSTGGLIAMMLGRLRMSVEEAYHEYIKLSPAIFDKLRHRINWKLETQGRYNSTEIEEGVKRLLQERGLDKNELFKDTSPQACKTFVCATKKENSQIEVFSSYYSKRRGTSMWTKAKIWEAVRATSAATTFFDTITIDGLEFADGATGANNPLNELWTEAKDQFKTDSKWELEKNVQCFVSIGTGIPNFTNFDAKLSGIVKTLTAIATDTQDTWEQFERRHTAIFKTSCFRFNVDRGLSDIGLDEINSIPMIRAATDTYLQQERVLDTLAACTEKLEKSEYHDEIIRLAERHVLFQKLVVTTEYPEEAAFKLCGSFYNTTAYHKWLHSSPPLPLVYNTDGCDVAFGLEEEFVATAITRFLAERSLAIAEEVDRRIFHHRCSNLEEIMRFPQKTGGNPPYLILKQLLVQLIASQIISSRSLEAVYKKYTPASSLIKGLRSSYEGLNPVDFIGFIDAVCLATGVELIIILSFDTDFSTKEHGKSMPEKFLTMLERKALFTNKWKLLIVGSVQSRLFWTVDADSERQDCLKSLAFEEIDFYLERIPSAYPGTNHWLWTHQTVKNWRQGGSSILWIRGKPGSGKSVLARTIIERGRAIQFHNSDEQTIMGDKLWTTAHRWIYSRRFEALYADHLYMLRSLILQLLRHNKQAFASVMGCWRRSAIAHSPRHFHLSELEEMLFLIVKNLNTTSLFIIDGFDEALMFSSHLDGTHNHSRNLVLRFLVHLVRESEHLKFIILSRPEPDIELVLGDHPRCHSIALEYENDADIKTLIDAQLAVLGPMLRGDKTGGHPSSTITNQAETLQKSRKVVNLIEKGKFRMKNSTADIEVHDDILDRIRRYLVSNARGVFVWVTVVFKELQDLATEGLVSWNDIYEVIQGLPTDLVQIYREITRELQVRLRSHGIKKAQKALEWVYVASQLDGHFTLQIMRDALSIPPNLNPTDTPTEDPFEAHRSLEKDWLTYRRSLYKLCGPFVDVVRPKQEDHESYGPYDTVQLIHTTVRDFLTSSEAGPLQCSTQTSYDNIHEDVQHYVRLSLPNWNNRYCSLPALPGSEWEENIIKMLEYLEAKPLLELALKAFPRTRQRLPYWVQDPFIGMYAVPSEVFLFNQSTPKVRSQREKLFQYVQIFHPTTLEDPIEESTKVCQKAASWLLSKFFCDGCAYGYVTAMRNLTAMLEPYLSVRGTKLKPYDVDYLEYKALNGALIAAICQKQTLSVRQLTARTLFSPGRISIGNSVPKPDPQTRFAFMRRLWARPQTDVHESEATGQRFGYTFRILQLALKHEDYTIFNILRERIVSDMRATDLLFPPQLAETEAECALWLQKTYVGPDPLDVVDVKPYERAANEKAVKMALDFIVAKYLPARSNRWFKALGVIRVCVLLNRSLQLRIMEA